MVVVPTFAVAEIADQNVVAAAFVGLVVAIAPQMSDRIYRPRLMPDDDGPHEQAPYQSTGAELNRRHEAAVNCQAGKATHAKEQGALDIEEPGAADVGHGSLSPEAPR